MIQNEMIDRMISNLKTELMSIHNTIESTIDDLEDLKAEVYFELENRTSDLFRDEYEGHGGTD